MKISYRRSVSWGGFGLSLNLLGLAFIIAALLLSGCAGQVPVESDSDQAYVSGSYVPLDYNYYSIKGTVVGDLISKDTGQAAGRIVGSNVGIAPGNGGLATSSFSGTYFPGGVTGKGFVRIHVEDSTPDTPLAPDGSVVILKTTDLKAIALLPGDYVEFICRAQFEAVAAVDNQERFDKELAGTWEIDYCRLKSPVLTEGAYSEGE